MDAASCAMSVNPLERPTRLTNNHAWHNQTDGEHLLAAARGGAADGTTDKGDAGKARAKGVEVAARAMDGPLPPVPPLRSARECPNGSADRCDRRHDCTELTPLSAAGTMTQETDGSLHVSDHEIPSPRSQPACVTLLFGSALQT